MNSETRNEATQRVILHLEGSLDTYQAVMALGPFHRASTDEERADAAREAAEKVLLPYLTATLYAHEVVRVEWEKVDWNEVAASLADSA